MSSHRQLARVLGGCLGLLMAGAPPVRAARLPVRGYTTAEGLPHDRVELIVQDTRGFLWFGTPEGLSRFDGYRFTTVGTDHGLPAAAVRAFVEHEGTFWVATEDGLCVFRSASSRCEPRVVSEDQASRHVFALFVDRAGRLWAGTDAGLFRGGAASGAFERIVLPGAAEARVIALAEAEDGGVWAGGRGGLWHIGADSRVERTRFGEDDELVFALLADGPGSLWIGNRGLTHLRRRAGTSSYAARLVRGDRGPAGNVRALARSADGTIWAGMQNAGLLEISGGQLRRHTVQSGLTSQAVRALREDRDGNLWIGTEARGIAKLARGGLVSYNRRDGLRNTRIVSLFGDRTGAVYAHSGGGVLHHFDGGGWSKFVSPLQRGVRGPFPFGTTLVLQDRRGAWWIGTGWGLFRFDDRTFADLHRTRPDARFSADPGGRAIAGPVFEDAQGNVWAGTVIDDKPHLLRWTQAGDATRTFALPSELPASARVRAFAQDRAGAYWIGLSDGRLVRFRSGRGTIVALGRVSSSAIHDLHMDASGRLWMAAEGAGLGRIDDPAHDVPHVVWSGRREGLASDAAYCVTEDRWGRIYAGTALGVTRLDPATGRLRHYGTGDGLAAGEVHSAFVDRHGDLWFGTTDGISRLKPVQEPAGDAPSIYIAGLRMGGVAQPLTVLGATTLGGFDLPRDAAQVEIDYGSLALGVGERLRYRYRLDGADHDWSPPTDRRTVSYARLAPGSYRFAVQAVNADGAASRQPAVVTFRVLPALWQRWWFVAATAGVVGLAGYAAFRYRLGMLLEVERVRLRVAADLHDDIGSNLSKIAILSEVAHRQEPEARQASLTQIADMARQLVDSMSDIVWAVNPNRDTLRDLSQRMRAFATELFSAMDVPLRFEGPTETGSVSIGADLRRQVFLIFKEAVTNAAAHARPRRVEVDLRVLRGAIELRVADDGIGFDPNAVSDGHGLQSLRERARAIGGALEIRSQPGGGTVVSLTAPLARRRAHRHYLTM